MFKTISLTLLFFVFCLSAAAQQPPTPSQSSHDSKLQKKLAHYDAGTKVDVQFTDGSHQIGTLGDAGSADFVLTDPASGKTTTIEYQDVKKVRTIRDEQISYQLGRTGRGLFGAVQIALITVGTIAIILLVVTFTTMHD